MFTMQPFKADFHKQTEFYRIKSHSAINFYSDLEHNQGFRRQRLIGGGQLFLKQSRTIYLVNPCDSCSQNNWGA